MANDDDSKEVQAIRDTVGVLTNRRSSSIILGVEASEEYGLMCPSCGRDKIRFDASYCDQCGKQLPHMQNRSSMCESMMTSGAGSMLLMSSNVDDLSFSRHLWNRMPAVQKKLRDSKHTARYMSEYMEQLADTMTKCGRSLKKLAADDRYGAAFAHEGPTLLRAWYGCRQQTKTMADVFVSYGQRLRQELCAPLTAVRKTLSDARLVINDRVSTSAKVLEKARAQYETLCKRRQQDIQRLARVCEQRDDAKRQNDTNVYRQLSTVCQRYEEELAAGADDEMMSQAMHFSAQNQHHQSVSKALDDYQELELQRIGELQSLLSAGVMMQNESWARVGESLGRLLTQVMDVNAAVDTHTFMKHEESGEVCPWISEVRPPPRQRRQQHSSDEATSTTVSLLPSSTLQGSAAVGHGTTTSIAPPSIAPPPRRSTSISRPPMSAAAAAASTTTATMITPLPADETTVAVPPPPPPPRQHATGNDAWHLLNGDQWNECAIERLILVGITRGEAAAEHVRTMEVMRVNQGMTSQKYAGLRSAMLVGAEKYGKNTTPPVNVLSVDFLVFLVRYVSIDDLEQQQQINYTAWRALQARLLLVHVFSSMKEGSDDCERLRALLATTNTTADVVAVAIEECVRLGDDTQHSVMLAPKLCRRLYAVALHAAYRPEEEEFDDDDDDDDDGDGGADDDVEPARLHHAWREIGGLLLEWRDQYSSSSVSEAFHWLSLMHVVTDVVDCRARLDTFTVFDTMAEDRHLLAALAEMVTHVDVTSVDRESDVESFALVQQFCAQFSEWLALFHHSDAHVVLPLMNVFLALLPSDKARSAQARRIIHLSTTTHYQTLLSRHTDETPQLQWNAQDWDTFAHAIVRAMHTTSAFALDMIVHVGGDDSGDDSGDGLSGTEWSLLTLLQAFFDGACVTVEHMRASQKSLDTQKLMPAMARVWHDGTLKLLPRMSALARTHVFQQVATVEAQLASVLAWLTAKKRKQLTTLVVRSIGHDSWASMSANHLNSSSAVDAWGMIDTMTNACWDYFDKMAWCGDGGGGEMNGWMEAVAGVLVEYSHTLVSTCGQLSDCRMPSVDHRRTHSRRSNNDEVLVPATADDRKSDFHRDVSRLAEQTMSSVCARASNCRHAVRHLRKFVADMHTKWAAVQQRVADRQRKALAGLVDGDECPLPRLVPLDGSLFDKAYEQINADALHILELGAVKLVNHDLRDMLIMRLYHPQATPATSVRGQGLDQVIDAQMGDLFKCVEPDDFAIFARLVFVELMRTYAWVLLYGGGRKFTPDVLSVLREDIGVLSQLFVPELGEATVAELSVPCVEIVNALGTSTETLVATLRPSADIVLQVLKQRVDNDKLAKKHVKSEKKKK